MADIIVARKKEYESSSKCLWIQGIGLSTEELHSVSHFLQEANIPYTFILTDDSLELLHPHEIADKFKNIADLLTRKFTESSVEAPTQLWA